MTRSQSSKKHPNDNQGWNSHRFYGKQHTKQHTTLSPLALLTLSSTLAFHEKSYVYVKISFKSHGWWLFSREKLMENRNQAICVSDSEIHHISIYFHRKIAEVEMVTGHLPFKCQVPDVAVGRTSPLHKKKHELDDELWSKWANGFMQA